MLTTFTKQITLNAKKIIIINVDVEVASSELLLLHDSSTLSNRLIIRHFYICG